MARSAVDLRSHIVSRQPVALVVAGDRLFVANRRSGTISVVDPATNSVTGEFRVGEQLSDLAASPDGRRLFAIDNAHDQLLLLEPDGRQCDVIQRFDIGGSPVTVCLGHQKSFCTVASLWARRVTLVTIRAPIEPARTDAKLDTTAESPPLTLSRQIDLPFAPRMQCLSADDARLYVADSFGGQIAAIDTAAGKLLSICQFDGHNIRGLALDETKAELIVAHQLLDEHIATTESHISWGGVISNVLRSIALEELFQGNDLVRQLAHWTLTPLGKTGDGMGDPGPVLLTTEGQVAVTLSGVGRLAFRDKSAQTFQALSVGTRPVAVVVAPDNRRLFVANAFDDSISVVDLVSARVSDTIALGPCPELTPAERGERLYYDARLSLQGWFSCQSCHTDGHTNGLLNDNLGDGSYGYPKRIPSLLGTSRTEPWAWNGTQRSLADQVRSSLRNTMHGPPIAASDDNVTDLVAYLESLTPPPGLARVRRQPVDAVTDRGKGIFERTGCATCHAPPNFTTPATHDVGIHDNPAATEFNPPSLLGVSQRGPFFHDSRAATLREVFERFHHGDTKHLSTADRDALLAYLQTL